MELQRRDSPPGAVERPAVYGIERSLHDARELIADAFAALTPFGPAANPLKSLANYLVERKH